jgi:hypothetical protein
MFKEQSSSHINLMFAPPHPLPCVFGGYRGQIHPLSPTTTTTHTAGCHADLTWY